MKRVTGRGIALVLCLSVVGCSATHVPEPPEVKADAIPPLGGGGAVAVTAKALRSGQRQIKVASVTFTFDEDEYAHAIASSVENVLREQGYPIAGDAVMKLDVTVVYVTALISVARIICYLDFSVATSDGYVRGYQTQGLSRNPEKACDGALENAVVATLTDTSVRGFLASQPGQHSDEEGPEAGGRSSRIESPD